MYISTKTLIISFDLALLFKVRGGKDSVYYGHGNIMLSMAQIYFAHCSTIRPAQWLASSGFNLVFLWKFDGVLCRLRTVINQHIEGIFIESSNAHISQVALTP